jgi:hypothetical protein
MAARYRLGGTRRKPDGAGIPAEARRPREADLLAGDLVRGGGADDVMAILGIRRPDSAQLEESEPSSGDRGGGGMNAGEKIPRISGRRRFQGAWHTRGAAALQRAAARSPPQGKVAGPIFLPMGLVRHLSTTAHRRPAPVLRVVGREPPKPRESFGAGRTAPGSFHGGPRAVRPHG